MYIDYTNLNEAYPKDRYFLPQINQIVDPTLGHELFTFMDAFLSYN